MEPGCQLGELHDCWPTALGSCQEPAGHLSCRLTIDLLKPKEQLQVGIARRRILLDASHKPLHQRLPVNLVSGIGNLTGQFEWQRLRIRDRTLQCDLRRHVACRRVGRLTNAGRFLK